MEAGLSFCTETVFSDPVGAKLGLLEEARTRGFAVFLIFIGLESPSLAVARVKQRVRHSGHDVPDAKPMTHRTVSSLSMWEPTREPMPASPSRDAGTSRAMRTAPSCSGQ